MLLGLLRTFAPTIWFLTFLLMIEDTFLRVLSREFPFNFNAEQEAVARELGRFIMTPNDDSAFILRGYAGTGKTTLIASLVKVMRKLNSELKERGFLVKSGLVPRKYITERFGL